ncbi:TAT-variant-translocated molybdopterin oxidoreductase [Sorangium sp. So ce1099]|uniref:TAT-variant-translocated molybdopterin oxidoreductase n=1 Tax=Sorangium sp. So ce1099 TaxID=3133331 RepID=UPI003F607AD0
MMADRTQTPWSPELDGKTGKAYWRSLAELLETPELRDAAARALPGALPVADDSPGAVSRRSWLKLLGASMALAGVSGCNAKPAGKIVPYVSTPPEVTPGFLRYYATSLELDGFATGVLVENHEGRPTKVEGNPEHPASLGATGVHEQASVLGLYDQHRARGARRGAGPAAWQAFVEQFEGARDDRGAGLRFVLRPTGSPLVLDLIGRIQERHPGARFTFHAPARSPHAARGAELAFGAPLQAQYDFRTADVILSLDADFLASMPFSLRYARQFAERRRIGSPTGTMSRLYVVEPGLTPTGTMADHRLRRRPSEVPAIAAAIAAELLLAEGARPGAIPAEALGALQPLGLLQPRVRAEDRPFIQALARDLARGAAASVVVAGERQPPSVHALAHVMNAALRSDRAAWATPGTLISAGAAEQDLAALADEIRRGGVDTLVILENNVAYTAPADLELSALLRAVRSRVYLGLYEDETAAGCDWFVPAAHELEAWGDARAYDGTISLVQPLIEPLFQGRTAAEVLTVFAGEPRRSARELLREAWRARRGGADFDAFLEEALRRGLVEGSAAPRDTTALRPDGIAAALGQLAAAAPAPADAIEVAFSTDANVYDGRFANNPWLLELPDPTTKLTWDNAALLSPETARALGVESEDVVDIELGGRSLSIPVLVAPGHADGTVSLKLGYGRSGAESIAAGVGFDAYRLRTSGAPFFAAGASVKKRPDEKHPLALTQRHFGLQGRPIALSAPLAVYREHPDFTKAHKGPQPSLMPEVHAPGVPLAQWAMTIDLTICTGCSSCVVACQAENNVLVVGKEEVLKSREMHWLRIDTYYSGDPRDPGVVHQPMLCQHCEKAPCEYVCPVNATTHSPDGLNEMTYNRCVGTRFCSNNCPYKVRRFNWFDYTELHAYNDGLARLQRNPDVTVRERGVMEKCTYCVQRIRRAEIAARVEQRAIRPGEVVTACQQACPTRAIQFGSLDHKETEMVAWRGEPRSFEVLHDQGTRPRTIYLARIDNENPELDKP